MAARNSQARARVGACIGFALVMVSGSGVAVAQDDFTAMPVKGPSSVSFDDPAAAGRWLTWGRQGGDAQRERVLAQRGTKPPLRISRRGTEADGGGITDRLVVYAERPHRPRTSDWDLYRFNLRTHRRSAFPRVVNGPGTENDPTIAGRFMLFHRGVRTTRGSVSKVMLYDRRTQSTQVLDREDRQFAGVSPGQVNGDYVVWAHWFRIHDGGSEPMPGSYDSIVRYHVPSKTTETVFYAEPGGEPFGTPFYRGAWSPGVSQDGTVYFWRDHYPEFWPGDDPHTELFRMTPGSAPLYMHGARGNFPWGGDTFVEDRAAGARSIYFAQDDAAGRKTYILKIIDPPPARS